MQSINQPQASLIAGMQSNPQGIASLQGQPFDQQLGGRGMYAGGGTAIGGGNFTGIPMGNRTGFGLLKKIKNRVMKLIPKEIAPAMMAAAPFMGPIAGPVMGGLGSYKATGKINPYVMAGAMAPHIRFGGNTGVGYGNWGGGSSIRNLLTGAGRGTSEGILNTKYGNFGEKLDARMFGKAGDAGSKGISPFSGEYRAPTDAIEGIFDVGGKTLKSGDLMEMLKGKALGKGNLLDKGTRLEALFRSSSNYAELLKNAAQQNIPEEAIVAAGITGEDDFTKWLNSQSAIETDQVALEGNAQGGLPRTRYAMGTAQFPKLSTRQGLAWGSDKGEGLGGQEVEADMRYEGGFMPYGEEPKADDVPARLSKDEFVFTDEAVAGAGDGDINVGAERLYNVMKNLEQGGRLSEESEGIAAQEMGAMI